MNPTKGEGVGGNMSAANVCLEDKVYLEDKLKTRNLYRDSPVPVAEANTYWQNHQNSLFFDCLVISD